MPAVEPTGTRLTAEDIAGLEGITPRGARKKYLGRADKLNGDGCLYIRHLAGRGGRRLVFDLALLDAETREKYGRQKTEVRSQKSGVRSQKSGVRSQELEVRSQKSGVRREMTAVGAHGDLTTTSTDTAACPAPSQFSTHLQQPTTPANPPQSTPAIIRQPTDRHSQADQLALSLYDARSDPALAPMPEAKRPLALARWKIIQRVVDGQWRALTGQTFHGIQIRNLDHYVQALARDSEYGTRDTGKAADLQTRSALLNWREIEEQLRIESNDLAAHLGPLSTRTIWRLISWFKKGKHPGHCPTCGAAVKTDSAHGQDAGATSECEQGHTVEPLKGVAALQDLDRSDKGRIELHPAHAEHLVSLFLSGDRTVKKARLQLQRPRSAQECWERLRLEIEVARELPQPVPSYYVVRRFYAEALPAILRRIASGGLESGWLRNKPYIPHLHPEAQVNDIWYCDFRSTNISAWADLDGKLYRIYLCAIMDHASRDVTVCFDFHPSAQLFKSALRLAFLTWGTPRQVWMDNGKEFTAEEVAGDGMRSFAARFDVDDDCKSLFARLGIEAHYCIPKNPDGKSPLERFFQQLDKIERQLPGWCGEKPHDTKGGYGRPDRWKHEAKLHRLFCANELPETPLWTVDDLVQFETRWIAAKYRALTKLHGGGLHGRTPAQIQAAFRGVRQIPAAAELDVLLWYRRRVRARGDKVSIDYHKRTLAFRSDALLALAGDCEVEVHVDPINAQRAVALDPLGKVPPMALELCEPRERSQEELGREMERQNSLRKRILGATLVASRLAPVRGPEEYLALLEQKARKKNTALAAASLNPKPQTLELPEYAAAIETLEESAPRAIPMTSEPVVTVDPRDVTDVERMFGK